MVSRVAPLTRSDFAALIEAAADYDDLSTNRYFTAVIPSSETGATSPTEVLPVTVPDLASGKMDDARIAVKLRDWNKLPAWARRLRRLLTACKKRTPLEYESMTRRLTAPLMDFVRHKLQQRLGQRKGAAFPRQVLERFEQQLEQRLANTVKACLNNELEIFENAYRCLNWAAASMSGEEIAREFLGQQTGDELVRLLRAYPALAKLWPQLVADWLRKVCELSERLRRDRPVLERTFFRGRELGEVIDIETNLSDTHAFGRETLIVHLRVGTVVYKPRSGRQEGDWFAFLRWVNRQRIVPRFRILRVLPRRNYCWMEFVRPRPCQNEAEARSYYHRAGALLGLAGALGAIDFHRENLIAAGDQPVLIDLETLFHPDSLLLSHAASPLTRTGLLPITGATTGSFGDFSAFGAGEGSHTPKLKGKALHLASYSIDMRRGFSEMCKFVGGSTPANGDVFRRRVRRMALKRWRRLHRATRTYVEIRERSLQPTALRSGLDRWRVIRSALGANSSEALLRQEIRALARLDIPRYYELAGWNNLPIGLSELPSSLQPAVVKLTERPGITPARSPHTYTAKNP